MTRPPAGAEACSETVPLVADPPVTSGRSSVTEATPTGRTVRVVFFVTLLAVAEIVMTLVAVTLTVLIVKVASVLPLVIITLTGTGATEVLLLESETAKPPLGAGAFNVMVPVEVLPPRRSFGVTMTAAGTLTVGQASIAVLFPST